MLANARANLHDDDTLMLGSETVSMVVMRIPYLVCSSWLQGMQTRSTTLGSAAAVLRAAHAAADFCYRRHRPQDTSFGTSTLR